MDAVADMMNSLKNAAALKKASVLVPYSNIKNEIAKILEKEGYLKRVTQLGKKNKKYLECFLAFDNANKPKISGVRRVSKLSRRIYSGFKTISPVRNGQGLAIISTPKGVLVDKEAKAAKVGGEVLVEVW